MPKIGAETAETQTYQLGGNFSFSGVRLNKLGATEYTLVSIAVDITGSVNPFADGLRDVLETTVASLSKSPRAANLLVRVIVFNSIVGARELHGFRPLSDIDVDKDYQSFTPDGATPLFDATYSVVSAMAKYGQELKDNDYNANGIGFIITDGEDNTSRMTPDSIRQQIEEIRSKEILESLLVFLIGVNAARCDKALNRFKTEAGLDEFIDIGDATPQRLAKLAKWVSQSTSSQSQALGTGGASQSIAATI